MVFHITMLLGCILCRQATLNVLINGWFFLVLSLFFQRQKLEIAAYDDGKIRRWGWFLYIQGEIKGPLNLEEVSSTIRSLEASDESVWVAQKGFKKWYLASLLLAELSRVDADQMVVATDTSRIVNTAEKLHQKAPPAAKQILDHGSGIWPHLEGLQTEDQLHFQVRARLRLGRLVSPWSVFFKIAFIPFWGWVSWLEESFVEAVYHLGETHRSCPRKFGLSWVPVVHFWFAYRFASLVCELECQNNYKKTSVWLAVGLSIFPPLFAFYMQASLTQHWRLHLKHVMQTAKKPGNPELKLTLS